MCYLVSVKVPDKAIFSRFHPKEVLFRKERGVVKYLYIKGLISDSTAVLVNWVMNLEGKGDPNFKALLIYEANCFTLGQFLYLSLNAFTWILEKNDFT